jgi:hypothetical protein
MNFPVFLNKWIIGNKYLRYRPIWWWYRLMSHEGFRFDDYHIWKEFWYSINSGWCDMEYDWEFEKFWGKGAKAEQIVLHREDYDAIVEKINNPDPEQIESLRKLLQRKSPWDD